MKQIEYLIPASDFIIEQENYISQFSTREARTFEPYNAIVNYAKFLKQPLTLGMFLPCDEQGHRLSNQHFYYLEAKERVLFEGFEIKDSSNGAYKGYIFKITAHEYAQIEYNLTTKRFFAGLEKIEDLIDYKIKLTPTALKQIYL